MQLQPKHPMFDTLPINPFLKGSSNVFSIIFKSLKNSPLIKIIEKTISKIGVKILHLSYRQPHLILKKKNNAIKKYIAK